MEKSKRRDYNKEFIEKKYTMVRSIIEKDAIKELRESINKMLKKHEFVDGNNPYITNKKRKAYNMYSMLIMEHTLNTDAPESYKKKKELILGEVYGEIIKPLEEELSMIFYLIRIQYWRVIGMTYMEIYEGSPAQEVHQDSPEGMNRIFITIPLENTSKEMGPTVFYDERIINKYRTKSDRDKNKMGNIGYYKDMKGDKKAAFEKGRVQYELEEGDITIHRDVTYHNGGENKTNKTRKFIFLVCDYTDTLRR